MISMNKAAPTFGVICAAALFALPATAQQGVEQDISANPDNCEVMSALTGSVPAECDTSSIAVRTRGISISGDGRTTTTAPTTTTTTTTAPPVTTSSGAAVTLQGAPADPTPRAASFSSIQFAVNSVALTPAAAATLDTVSEVLRDPRFASATLLVEGHTDASGSADYNMDLSERRAASVVDYLTQRGVDPKILNPRGMGESRLANPSNPNSGENRRVVIVNLDG